MILYGYFIQAASVFQVCRQDATMTGKCGRIRQTQAAAACVFGGRKSIRFDELDEAYFFNGQGYRIPYLEKLDQDLVSRQEQEEESK